MSNLPPDNGKEAWSDEESRKQPPDNNKEVYYGKEFPGDPPYFSSEENEMSKMQDLRKGPLSGVVIVLSINPSVRRVSWGRPLP